MLTICYDVKRSPVNRGRGFTLVELLIVISIIGVLVALTMPAINMARESGRQATCKNNLHQLALGCQAHEAQWQRFPSGGLLKSSTGVSTIAPGANQPGGWLYNILPFIDQKDLHDEQDGLRGQNVVPVFLCPTRHRLTINTSGFGMNDYAGNAGSLFIAPGTPSPTNVTKFNGVIYQASAVSTAQIKDGLPQTYLIGERFMTTLGYPGGTIENDVGWDSGYDYNTIRWTASGPSPDQKVNVTTALASLFGSAHQNGFHMAFCDGSVRKMNYLMSTTVHTQLGARADGEPTQMQNTY